MGHGSWIMESSLNAALFLYVLTVDASRCHPYATRVSRPAHYTRAGGSGCPCACPCAPFLVRLTGLSETDVQCAGGRSRYSRNGWFCRSLWICSHMLTYHTAEKSHRRTRRRVHGCIEERLPNPYNDPRGGRRVDRDHIDTINTLQNLLRRYRLHRCCSCSYLRRIPCLRPYLCFANRHPFHRFHSPCPCSWHHLSVRRPPEQTPSRETASTPADSAASQLILPMLWRVSPTTRGLRG
jgi:hypothetical protein